MKVVTIIMRKELYRVFSDKKLIFGLFILPAILVVGMFLLMAALASSLLADWEEHEPTVAVYHTPASFEDYMQEYESSVGIYEIAGKTYHVMEVTDDAELETLKGQIYDGSLDLIVVFPEDFDEQVAGYNGAETIPEVQTFYNPSEDYSQNAHQDVVDQVLEKYRKVLLERRVGDLSSLTIFNIDQTNEESVIQNDNKAQGKLLGSVIPYMVTILLFASAMSLGTDSFAGEKERGTMASLLMTPIKRSQIVYGKLFALMILSGLSALIYGGSMIFAMPLFYRTLGTLTGQELNFSAGQMSMLLALIVTMVFMYVAVIAWLSTLAKNVKEASTYVTPAYLAVTVVGMFTIFRGDDTTWIQYLIPIYGPTMALKNIFTLELTAGGFLLALLSNLIFGALFAGITAKMFYKEKIMMNA